MKVRMSRNVVQVRRNNQLMAGTGSSACRTKVNMILDIKLRSMKFD